MSAQALLHCWRRLRREQGGVTATETAFLLPVLLFALMILFELARIAIMIAVGSLALEHAVQDFRQDKAFYQKSPEILQADIEERMLTFSYGFLNDDNLEIDVLPFDNLHLLGQNRSGQYTAKEDKDDQSSTLKSPPILSITVDLTQTFMTPLPALFGLGSGFQYQYRHLLGNLPSDDPSEDNADA